MNRLLIFVIALLSRSAVAVGVADELGYSPDGGLVSFGEFDYVYDSASRLTEVWSNGARVVENKYDALGRRVIKRTPDATHTFVYDRWLLMVERIERSGGQRDQIDYWWGKDISGTLDGAGGIGGLLYIRKNGCEVYVPLYDGMGNVVQYVDKHGTLVASYSYDAFGNTTQKSGAKADELKMRFSTKYFDDEAGLYYFGRRFYSPRIARWLARDPIEEEGGMNLYAYCGNNPIILSDKLGEDIYLFTGNDSGRWLNDKLHQSVGVDLWSKKGRKIGRTSFTFAYNGNWKWYAPSFTWLGFSGLTLPGYFMEGEIEERHVPVGVVVARKKTTCQEDREWFRRMKARVGEKDVYSVGRHNCRNFAQSEFDAAPGSVTR